MVSSWNAAITCAINTSCHVIIYQPPSVITKEGDEGVGGGKGLRRLSKEGRKE